MHGLYDVLFDGSERMKQCCDMDVDELKFRMDMGEKFMVCTRCVQIQIRFAIEHDGSQTRIEEFE
tara:strand:- start:324 stop:518 length:195 start_codon:yes stop_codon:yes gene_type:complete